MANTLSLRRNGAVGFIDWSDDLVMFQGPDVFVSMQSPPCK